ncbi:hypothetical protein Cgig2_025685 [Carnegiea gigantea]|uniref:Peptidase A2 domain-containing protein n=1 Tax=Carnegiea gigantea TaxID=171969 RepID=A0A9Q1JTY3_9CARY|nr:hypothetical protein Cgig2_025685 [Carnegiea gigantea]
MMDTINRRASEQVEGAMEAANSARPLPHFDYVPTHGGEPFHPPERVPSPRYTEWEQESGHTTTECGELKKTLYELADKGQIDRFLKRRPRFLQREQEPAQPQPQDEECSTEVVATIAGGPRTIVPIVVFGGKEAPRFASPHNDPLVVEMKITSAIVRRNLIDTGSSVDIITWDCLKKLTHPERDIVPLVHPILGFGGMSTTSNFKKQNEEERRKNTEKEGGLHISLSTILMTLPLRSLGLSIQGVSCLIPCTLTLAKRRNKFHLLRSRPASSACWRLST